VCGCELNQAADWTGLGLQAAITRHRDILENAHDNECPAFLVQAWRRLASGVRDVLGGSEARLTRDGHQPTKATQRSSSRTGSGVKVWTEAWEQKRE